MKNKGGAAFPNAPNGFIDRNPGGRKYDGTGSCNGMTLRQFYAAQAVTGLGQRKWEGV